MITARIQSIDFLRGMVMVFMALDHSRTFLHTDLIKFNAEDLTQTNPALFFTRWITHFCAPVFIFLVGTSSYLMLQKTRSKKQLTRFLVTRALLLILLELTLFRFCWQPNAPFFQPFILLVVIWAIGISMLFLAVLIWLPFRVILFFGIAVLLFHNTLASVHFAEGSNMDTFWAFFYKGGYVNLTDKIGVMFLYPVLPYFGLIALGYCMGYLYTSSFTAQRRRKILTVLGAIAILAFMVLRYFNLYGDPKPWEPGRNTIYSVMAFLRATKYPLSLQFALMTLGPSLLVLAWIEPVRNRIVSFFVTIGSVPMFYYILHLILFVLTGFILGFYSQNLAMVYVVFVIVVFILYLLCKQYAAYKARHPQKKWLKYL